MFRAAPEPAQPPLHSQSPEADDLCKLGVHGSPQCTRSGALHNFWTAAPAVPRPLPVSLASPAEQFLHKTRGGVLNNEK